MDITTLVLFIAGLILLIVGAESLVRGASRLAAAVGISPLVVGLTVVAYGTSAPELAVTLQSALAGQADMGLGNVVGSNIFNVLLVLGLSAAIAPLVVSKQLVRLEVPLMIGLSFLVLLLGLDGRISRLDGLALFAGAIGYTVFVIRQSRRENRTDNTIEGNQEQPERKQSWPVQLGLIAAGLGLLILGSRWLVDGAIVFARLLGVSELIIGLTIIAAGTSLPEVATSVIASMRGQRDISVGNVVGSNIFNIVAVLGLASALSPLGISVPVAALGFDIPVMIAVAVACLPVFFTGRQISRWEGWLFLAYYGAYTLYLLLDAAQHDALPVFNTVMLAFVLPLTAITLIVLSIRARSIPETSGA